MTLERQLLKTPTIQLHEDGIYEKNVSHQSHFIFVSYFTYNLPIQSITGNLVFFVVFLGGGGVCCFLLLLFTNTSFFVVT